MNPKELSAYAGLSLQTIYNLVHKNEIPHRRISKKRVEFDREEIDEWLRTRKRKGKRPDMSPVEEACLTLPSSDIPGAGKESLLDHPGDESASSRHLSRPQIGSGKRYFFFLRPLPILLFVAIGWAGGYFYFRFVASPSPGRAAQGQKGAANSVVGSSPGVIGLASVIEQSRPGRVEVRIPSSPSESAEVHVNRISDLGLQNETNALIWPLLIQALRDGIGDYASRSRTIDIFRPYADDPRIQEAIIYLAKNEKDPSLRLKAITVLDKVADSDAVKDVLLDRLMNDDNSGIRFKALEIIEKNMDRRSIQIIEKVKDRETDESIRSKAKTILANFQRGNV